MTDRRGFTLIELLVVISIIGLLATFAVIQLGGSRDKARIARGLSFARSLTTANANNQPVGIWGFDECHGTEAGDLSGYGNAGTLGASQTWSTETPSGSGCSLNASAGTNLVVSDSSSLNITDDLTISLWLYPVTDFVASQVIPLQKYANTSYANWRVYYNGTGSATNRRISVSATRGGAWGGISPSYYLELGKWTHYALVYNSVTGGQLYIDGKAVNTPYAVGGGALTLTTANVLIGNGFPGYIDDVRVLRSSLTAQEIHQMYAEGTQTKEVVAKK